jgi:uncharacterized protein (DUF1499 family)
VRDVELFFKRREALFATTVASSITGSALGAQFVKRSRTEKTRRSFIELCEAAIYAFSL